jgi:cell division protein FtsI (penicillin-binding protein 3)
MPRASSKQPAAKRPAERGPADFPPERGHRMRMRLVLWIFLAAFACVAVRLYQLQTEPPAPLSEHEGSRIGRAQVQGPRGDIVDRGGWLLATDRQRPSLWADPARLENPRAVAQHLAPILGEPEADVLDRLTRRTPEGNPMRFVYLARRLDPETERRLGDLSGIAPRGLHYQFERTRYYPESTLASQVLGFVNHERVGSAGVELAFDRRLRSTPEERVALKDGRTMLLPSLTLDYTAPTGGNTVHLTIDKNLQRRLEQELDRAIAHSNAETAMGVLLDPQTGAVLAMACRPAFDPNAFTESEPALRKNRSVTDVFEPGSAFKIVTAAAALEAGILGPHDPIDCEGGYFKPPRLRRIRDTHELDVVPFSEAFAESSNIAVFKLAAQLGPSILHDWIRRFGFGEATGVDLPAESAGILRPVDRWTRHSMRALPMGQELSCTLLQLARAYAAVANGGRLVTPYVVAGATGPDGEVVYEHEPAPARRVLSEETASLLRAMCHQVVTQGTGTRANIDTYRVGGKTGTAQIARPDGTGYFEDRYDAVFAGFAPVGDPRVCGAIVVHAPELGKHHGGYAPATVFREVVRPALVRMHVPADPVQVAVTVPPLHQEDPDTVVGRAELDVLEPPLEDLLVAMDGLELVSLEPGAPVDAPRLPSFLGMTKRQTKQKAMELKMHWTARGSGWVIYQDPPPGTPLYEVNVVRLVYANERATAAREPDPDAIERTGPAARG